MTLRRRGLTALSRCAALLASFLLASPGWAAPEEEDAASETQDEASDVMALEPVRVEAHPIAVSPLPMTTERVEVVEGEDLRRWRSLTLADAMRRVAGGVAVQPVGTVDGLSLDGLPAAQLHVLIDGVPAGGVINTPQGPITDLGTLPIDPSRIERIEVYRGAGPAGSGGSSGVVVNIVTRPPEQLRGALHVGQGQSAGTLWETTVGGSVSVPLSERLSLGAHGSWLHRPPLDISGDDRWDTPEQRVGAGSIELAARDVLGARWRIAVDGRGQQTDVRQRRGAPALGAPPEDRTRTHVVGASVQSDRGFAGGGTWTGRTRLSRMVHRFVKVVPASGDELPRSRTVREQLRWSGNAQLPAGDRWMLDPEAAVEGERVQRTGATGAFEDVHEGRLGLGLGSTWFVTDALEATARGWADLHSQLGLGGIASLQLAWGPLHPLRLTAGVSRARRLPSVEERFLIFDHSEVGYRIEGADSLHAETLTTWRGGASLTLADLGLQTTVEGFVHQLEESIEPVLVAGGAPALYSYANTGSARSAGLTAQGTWRGPYGMRLSGGWTWLPVRTSGADDGPRALTVAHGWNAQLSWNSLDEERWGAWIRADGRTALATAPGTPNASPAWTLDSAVEGRLVGPLALRLEARNLFDTTDLVWGPSPGRSVHARLSVAW